MKTIHDSGYKKLFSNKVIFRQLIETFVPEDWVKDLDFDSCERLDKSFLSAHYKKTKSDIIYKLRLKDKDVYILILIEFQSTVDRFMSLRILNYITNFYMDYVESNKNVKQLPPVFPILLYNGDSRWAAPLNLSELIENNELLGRYSLQFEYFKIAENEYSKGELLKIRNIVSTLFLAESYYDIELLKEEFLAVFKKEEDKQAISLFLNWFKQLSEHQRIDQSDFKELEQVYKNAEEVNAMLITSLKKEREEIYKTGEIKGKNEQRLIIARTMLINNELIEKIKQYTELPETEILKLKSEL